MEIKDRSYRTTNNKFRPSMISGNTTLYDFTNISDISTGGERRVLQIKIIVLGDVSVGKTSAIKRLKYDSFTINPQTLSIDFTPITFQVDESGGYLDALIWDTCGEERFRSITKTYYNDINGAIIFFDVSNRSSFESLTYWIKDLSEQIPKKNNELITPIIISGNKCDISQDKREVGFVEADNFCRENGLKYYEVSAKTGYNIKNLFEELIGLIMIKVEEKTQIVSYLHKTKDSVKRVSSFSQSAIKDNSIYPKNFVNQRKGGCC